MSNKATQFKKGESGNPAGKPKGTKNRTTQEIRDFIQLVVDNNLDRLQEDLDKMNPTNRWNILDKVAKYTLPTLSKNDNSNINSGDIIIKVEYADAPPIQIENNKPLELDNSFELDF